MSLSSLTPEPVTEIIHGTTVVDPYRWLEDRGLPETEEWIAAQQQRCDQYFAECGDLDALRERVRGYLDVEVVDQPARVAGQDFYRRRNQGQEQGCIYVRDIDTGNERLLVDPLAQGPFASVAIHCISKDGSLLAYALKQGGADARAIYIVDTATGQTVPGHLPIGYAQGFAFAADRSGFYYCHDPLPVTGEHTICLHRFAEMTEDTVLFRKERTRNSRLALIADDVHIGALWIREHRDGPLLGFWISKHQRNPQWSAVFEGKLGFHGPLLYRGRIFVLTDCDAPNKQLLELTVDGTESHVVIPESDAAIQGIATVGDLLYPFYRIGSRLTVHGWTVNGSYAGEIEVPKDGTVQILPTFCAEADSLFYSYESFTEPLTILQYNPATRTSATWSKRTHSTAGPSYCISTARFPSIDGVEILMSLVMRDDLSDTSPQPAILTSYGGFGISMTPRFSVLVTIMLELGAVFALPNIRGGSEFGDAWHQAARGRNRQTAFNDFVGAAEWLIKEGVTSPNQLAIFGGSNSGLLVGVAMTQRPDLFRAVLCIAPLLDMVRYDQFDRARRWKPEYGTIEDPQDFRTLHAYSPYHRIADDTNYPSTLFVSGDRDDRCNPAHVRKTAARLQNRTAQRNPILVDYCAERGHSPVLPLSVRTDALTRRIAFLSKELGITIPPGKREP